VKVTIRRFQEGDEGKALRFLNSVFENWGTSRKWNWKFREVEKAMDRKTTIWVVEDDGEIVGHLAAIPMELEVEGKALPVCQLVDGGLHPEYRHRGIYRSLVQKVLMDVKGKGNVATFGFANRPSHRVYVPHRCFRDVCEITKMFKILSLRNAVKTVQARLSTNESDHLGDGSMFRDFLTALRGKAVPTLLDMFRTVLALTISYLLRSEYRAKSQFPLKRIEAQTLGTRFEKTWIGISPNYGPAVERDCKYLTWRYGNPEVEYEVFIAERASTVVGYVVIASEEKSLSLGKIRLEGFRIGYIIDLVAEKDLTMHLISTAEEELKKKEVCLAYCWTTEDSVYLDEILKMQYYRLPKQMYKITMVANVHTPHLETDFFSSQGKERLISLGDSDLV
jgi:predicted N-acetyltransferase YhbS